MTVERVVADQRTLTARTFGLALLIGFVGWLAVAGLDVTGPVLWLWAFLLGMAVGLLLGGGAAHVGLFVGMLSSYPIAFATGLYLFVGEGFLVLTSLFLVVAGVGNVIGRFLAGLKPSREPYRSTAPNTSAALSPPNPNDVDSTRR